MLSYWPSGYYVVNFAENHIDLNYCENFAVNSAEIVHGKDNDGVCPDVVDGKVLDKVGLSSVMLFLSVFLGDVMPSLPRHLAKGSLPVWATRH